MEKAECVNLEFSDRLKILVQISSIKLDGCFEPWKESNPGLFFFPLALFLAYLLDLVKGRSHVGSCLVLHV